MANTWFKRIKSISSYPLLERYCNSWEITSNVFQMKCTKKSCNLLIVFNNLLKMKVGCLELNYEDIYLIY
jgi:hypothetical protein